MKIRELFRGDIERPIETVIHVDLSDEATVAHEIEEYVVTENIREHLEELVDVYADTARNPSESTNVWVSGFFGSGKSSFAKTVGYALADPVMRDAQRLTGFSPGPTRTSLRLSSTPLTRWPRRSRCSSIWPADETCCARERASCSRCTGPCSSASATHLTSCWLNSRSRWRRRVVFRPSRRRCWRRPMAGLGASPRCRSVQELCKPGVAHHRRCKLPKRGLVGQGVYRAQHRPQLAR